LVSLEMWAHGASPAIRGVFGGSGCCRRPATR
jgi:hypothetical protein